MYKKGIPSPLAGEGARRADGGCHIIYKTQLYWLLLSLLILLLDQWSKHLATHFLILYQPLPIISFFNLTLAYNKGAAFSLFDHAGNYGVWFLSAFAVVMSLFLFIWLLRLSKNNIGLSIALALILGGALGNLLDRVLYGYVVDFIDIYVHTWHWPAFNIADSAICIGITILFFCIKKQQK